MLAVRKPGLTLVYIVLKMFVVFCYFFAVVVSIFVLSQRLWFFACFLRFFLFVDLFFDVHEFVSCFLKERFQKKIFFECLVILQSCSSQMLTEASKEISSISVFRFLQCDRSFSGL